MPDEKRTPGARARGWILGALKVLVPLALVGAGAWWFFQQRAGAEPPRGPTLAVSRGEIRQTAEATGKIEPHVQVDVQPRASGEVSEVLVAEGDVVEVGQVLFRLDARDAERDLEDARVTLRKASAEVAQARANRDDIAGVDQAGDRRLGIDAETHQLRARLAHRARVVAMTDHAHQPRAGTQRRLLRSRSARACAPRATS